MITAVVVEGRTQGEVARAYGVSQGWVSRLVARYRAEGETAFEPRSRRPKTSPTAIDPSTVELIVRIRKDLNEQGLDAGPETIAWLSQVPARARITTRLRNAAGRRVCDAGSTVIQAGRDLHLSGPTVMDAFRQDVKRCSGQPLQSLKPLPVGLLVGRARLSA